MPLQTDLNISPYFDDFDETNDYYKILFRPGVSVQVRELNQLQTNLQKQVERFGDFILQTGTIVSGCGFTYHSYIPFVKLQDTTNDGQQVDPENYVGLFVNSATSGLTAEIVSGETGYEAQDPNLATLYLNYRNAGTTANVQQYIAGEILKVYNRDERLYSVKIANGSTGFTNNDIVIFQSALEVQNTTGGVTVGSFTPGEVLTQDTTLAQAILLSVETGANAEATVLRVKPLANQLSQSNTASWAFGEGYEVVGATSNATANVVGFAGSGATGQVRTAAAGRVDAISIVQGGEFYYVVPHVTIMSSTANTGEIGVLDTTAKNYLANVTISTVNNSVGGSYGMSVDEGVIYQKGYFARVAPHFAVISKYSNTPNDVAVGFTTVESIVNSSSDSTLLDNATGELNENAPGANRLKLTPVLTAQDKLAADDDLEFLTIIEFTDGKPHTKVNAVGLNGLGDELARRTYDESGNYVLDPFLCTTTDRLEMEDTENYFSVVIDAGKAYLNGYRIETTGNYTEIVDKAKDELVIANNGVDLVYGNYVIVDEFGGSWEFTEGNQVQLRSAAGNFLSEKFDTFPISGAVAGSIIGYARVRSVALHSGIPGTPNCQYKVYLFDISMSAGKNFRDVKSIYLDTVNDGLADCVLETDPSTSASVAVLKNPANTALIFGSEKMQATKTANVTSWQYRTTNNSVQANTLGIITMTSGAGEDWPWSGSLSSAEKQTLIISPRDVDIVASANIAGSLNVAANGLATGSGTSFLTELAIGDYITLNDGGNTAVARVESIATSTAMNLSSTANIEALSTANAVVTYPINVPIPFADRDDRNANVTGTSLFIDLGNNITAISNVTVTHDVKVVDGNQVVKTVNRKNYIKIQANTHNDTTVGPWCVGFSDVIRLRAVYAGETTSDTDITKHFYIDNNHAEEFYDLGYLYLRQESTYAIGADDILLVEFDWLQHSGDGLKTVDSYNINDGLPLANLDSTGEMHTLEIPEFNASEETYYDLRDSLDFRPITANTVAGTTTPASAPINPAEPTGSTRFGAGNKKFPVPESDAFLTYTIYEERYDSVIAKSDNSFEVLQDEVRAPGNPDEIVLYRAFIPAYPTLPATPSEEMQEIMETDCGTGTTESVRQDRYQVDIEEVEEQPRGYTMEDIGSIERRVETLEYYSQLSQIEDGVNKKVIPSAIDGTINRFKFGFFVDNFTSDEYTAEEHPEYNASLFEYRLQASRNDLDIELRFADSGNTNSGLVVGEVGMFPHEPYTFVTQKNITDGPVAVAPPPPVSSYATKYVFRTAATSKSKSSPTSNTDTVFEDRLYTLASNTDANNFTCTLYFNALGGKDRYEIYQSTSVDGTYVAVANSESCLAPTQSEVNDIRNRNLYSKFNFGARTFSRQNASFRNNYWVINSGTLSFAYDVSKGRYLKVRVVKGSPQNYYALKFPIESLAAPVSQGYLIPAPKIAAPPIVSPTTKKKSGITTSAVTAKKGYVNRSKPVAKKKVGFKKSIKKKLSSRKRWTRWLRSRSRRSFDSGD